jgi:hypothetical protein
MNNNCIWIEGQAINICGITPRQMGDDWISNEDYFIVVRLWQLWNYFNPIKVKGKK